MNESEARKQIEAGAAIVMPEKYGTAYIVTSADGAMVFGDLIPDDVAEARCVKFATYTANGKKDEGAAYGLGAETPEQALNRLVSVLNPLVAGKRLYWRIYPETKQHPDNGSWHAYCRLAATEVAA